MTTIGVLALQGDFAEHEQMLEKVGAQAREVRKPEHLKGLDGLIIPGGESTSMGIIAARWGLVEPLRAWVRSGRPTWGTCAGMVLLAERVVGQKEGGQPVIGGLDITVNRNYFGRQVDSFEADLVVPALGDPPIRAIFIRAPAAVQVGPDVEVLATVPGKDGQPVAVAVRQGAILATAFHPELTEDLRWHRFFLQIVSEARHATPV